MSETRTPERHEAERALRALHLEAPASVVADVARLVHAALDAERAATPPGDPNEARDFAVRVTVKDGREPLILPTPSGVEQARATAATIAGDDAPTEAEVVWRPQGGWRPL